MKIPRPLRGGMARSGQTASGAMTLLGYFTKEKRAWRNLTGRGATYKWFSRGGGGEKQQHEEGRTTGNMVLTLGSPATAREALHSCASCGLPVAFSSLCEWRRFWSSCTCEEKKNTNTDTVQH